MKAVKNKMPAPSSQPSYKSAYERLRVMPVVFNAISFARLNGLTSHESSVYLARMKARKMIDSLTGRAGIYFNLVNNQEAKSEYLIDGLKMVYRSLIYRQILHR